MNNQYSTAIAALETVFGKSSEAGFGSAVFHEVIDSEESLERTAQGHYREFLGPKWNAETEQAWMSPWKMVYQRQGRSQGGIVSELASVSDSEAKRSVPLLTEFISDPDAAVKALDSVFDHEQVKRISIFTIGDGAAMAGIMITAIYDGLYCCSVIALMD